MAWYNFDPFLFHSFEICENIKLKMSITFEIVNNGKYKLETMPVPLIELGGNR